MPLPTLTRRRTACAALVILICAGLFFWRLRGTEAAAVRLQKGDLLQTVVVTGRVTSLARASLGSRTLGKVAAVLVEAGDSVRVGTPLLRLDDREARAAAEQAQGVLREAELRLSQLATLDTSLGDQRVREAEAGLRLARSTYDRTKMLHDQGIVSQADLDAALKARDVAESQLEREQLQRSANRPGGSDVRIAKTRLEQAQAALRLAEERLAQTTITAPGNGVVITRKVEVGDVVQAGEILLTLSVPGRTQVVAQVDEKNLALLKPMQEAKGSADAYPDQSFAARVATIVPAVDPQRGTVELRCDVQDPPRYLVPDMTVSLEIVVQKHQGVLTLPADLLRDAATSPWVLAVRDGRAVRQPVTLGISGSGSCEVRSGLREGELVLLPSTPVKPGSRVRPVVSGSGSSNAH